MGINAMDKMHEESKRQWSRIFDVKSAPGIQVSALGENLSTWGR
jgi:hypothetical protein